LHEDRQGFLRPELITAKDMQAGQQTHLYGLFSSKRAATTAMASIAKKSLLCEGLLGLEKLSPGAPCFGFQVKVCAGACVGKESPLKHNLKLTTALTRLRISLWPYKGPVGIKEGEEIHVVDQWCYLGSAKDDAQLDDILQQGRGEFEMDTYQLLKKSMAHLSSDALVQLTRRPVEKETLDTFA
jgi:DNA polymerase-3 subunit epsilon